MIPILHLSLISIVLTLGMVFAYLAISERDLLKAIVYSAGQAAMYVIAFYLLMAPDIVLAYAAVGVGVYSAVMIIAVKKTERYEKP